MAICREEIIRRRRKNQKRRIVIEGAAAADPTDVTLPTLSDLSLQATSTAGQTEVYAFTGTINNDGTAYYTADELESGKIYGYPISTAFDITTLGTTDGNSGANGLTGSEIGMCFSHDGNYIIYGDYSGNRVYMRACTTAWDATTIEATNESFVNLTNSYANWISDDGTFFLGVNGSNRLVKYTMSTPYDLGTASLSTTSPAVQGSSIRGIVIDDTGERVWLLDVGKTIYQYSMSTGFDTSTMSYDSVSLSVTDALQPNSIQWRDNKLFINYYSTTDNQVVKMYSV